MLYFIRRGPVVFALLAGGDMRTQSSDLDRALSAEGNPEFATVMKVIRALGIKLHARSAHG